MLLFLVQGVVFKFKIVLELKGMTSYSTKYRMCCVSCHVTRAIIMFTGSLQLTTARTVVLDK